MKWDSRLIIILALALRTKAYHNMVYLINLASIAVNCDAGCAANILTWIS